MVIMPANGRPRQKNSKTSLRNKVRLCLLNPPTKGIINGELKTTYIMCTHA